LPFCRAPLLDHGSVHVHPKRTLLGLENWAEALLGSLFQMNEWMEENGSSAVDEEFVGRIRHERDDALDALRLTRVQIRSARKALSQ
jgi:hypothetical protein